MNYSKIITTGLGFLLGLVVYHFVKKALNGNGSVSVSEEETANAIGLKGLRRPGVLKAPSVSKLRCNCDAELYPGVGYTECYMGVDMKSCDTCCSLAQRVRR
jgi:hypothetical protein